MARLSSERMRPCVKLVVILLTLIALASALDRSSLNPAEQDLEETAFSTRSGHVIKKLKRPGALKIHRPITAVVTSVNNGISSKKNIKRKKPKIVKVANNKVANNNKLALIHDVSDSIKKAEEVGEEKRRHKKMHRGMMALLLAYKLKFATLIPTLMGGLVLLISNTALAGFFFALFAAVLGLKHG